MAKSRGELTGLEWEAEKAYIVATSPRNAILSNDEDDFSFDVVEIVEKQPVRSQEVVTSARKQPSVDGSNDTPCTDEETFVSAFESEPGSVQRNDEQTVVTEVENDHQIVKGVENDAQVGIEAQDAHVDEETRVDNGNEAQSKGLTLFDTCTSTSPSVEQLKQDTDADEETNPQIHTLSGSSSTSSHGVVIESARKSIVKSESQILVIYGPSGFGKGVLVQKMVYRSPQQFSLVVSYTTRPQRLQEMYARDFYFVSKPEMIEKIKENAFMEYVQLDHIDPVKAIHRDYSQQNAPRTSIVSLSSTTGEIYGTTWESFQEALLSNKPCVVLNISTKGAEQIQALGIDATFVLLHPGKDPEGCGTIDPNYAISIDNKEEAFGCLEEYALRIAQKDSDPASPCELDKTLEEWERVPNIQLSDVRKHPRAKGGRKQQMSHKPTSFGEMLNHYQNANLTEQLANIKPEVQSKFFNLSGPPKINKRLRQERDMIFAIALCKFDDCNSLHTRSLSTIYRRLTGGGLGSTCMRFGSHWEEIGFQGSDPTDDLRGVGMLGLVQLVWLLETPLVQLIALDVYQYSRQHDQQLPFCVLLLNITCMTLQALREGCLSKECNRRDQVFGVINDFTASILLSFFHTWQKQQRGPMEVGIVLQNVGAFAKKHPRFFMKELKSYLTQLEKKETEVLQETDSKIGSECVEFTKIENENPASI